MYSGKFYDRFGLFGSSKLKGPSVTVFVYKYMTFMINVLTVLSSFEHMPGIIIRNKDLCVIYDFKCPGFHFLWYLSI